MLRTRSEVISGVATVVADWVETRLLKLRQRNHDTLSMNPFLLPLLMHLHNHQTFSEVASFVLIAHFGVGHSTGFGKLFDEKILPGVFGCTKLDAQYRRRAPFSSSMFDEIDHLVPRPNGHLTLLSLKSSRWTIQLTMAKQLNATFAALLDKKSKNDLQFDDIVLGVIYGGQDGLTDKYRLVRGLDNAVGHSVINISSHVSVHAGKQFWTWLNEDDLTQEWIMQGIISGISHAKTRPAEIQRLLATFQKSFEDQYRDCVDGDGKVNWINMINLLN